MKRLVLGLVAFTLITLLGWPYLYLYRLDRAVAAGDMPSLALLVDVEAVRTTVKAQLADRIDRTMGGRPGSLLGWIQEGVTQIGDRAIDIAIDLDWVYQTLRYRNRGDLQADPSLLSDTTYAFFESPDRFLIRIGEPGDKPLHVRMRLTGGRWVVTEIYER